MELTIYDPGLSATIINGECDLFPPNLRANKSNLSNAYSLLGYFKRSYEHLTSLVFVLGSLAYLMQIYGMAVSTLQTLVLSVVLSQRISYQEPG